MFLRVWFVIVVGSQCAQYATISGEWGVSAALAFGLVIQAIPIPIGPFRPATVVPLRRPIKYTISLSSSGAILIFAMTEPAL
jgi:hypothetical protein